MTGSDCGLVFPIRYLYSTVVSHLFLAFSLTAPRFLRVFRLLGSWMHDISKGVVRVGSISRLEGVMPKANSFDSNVDTSL